MISVHQTVSCPETERKFGAKNVDELLSEAWTQNFSGTKKRRILPPWFRLANSVTGQNPEIKPPPG